MLSELLLRSALDHVARGWPVFPLRPGDKRPAIRDWGSRATTDPDRIRRAWTAAPYNVGVACGRASLVVVGLDTPKPGTESRPRGDSRGSSTARTCSPRWLSTHVRGWRSRPTPSGPPAADSTAGRLGRLIDARAAGGYVVGRRINDQRPQLHPDSRPAGHAAPTVDYRAAQDPRTPTYIGVRSDARLVRRWVGIG